MAAPEGQLAEGFGGCAVVEISAEESVSHEKSAVSAAAVGAPTVVFLNRAGGTFYPGTNDSATNRSSIVGRTYTVPAFSRGTERWNDIVSCVRDQFARFNVIVTDVEPTQGSYVETVVAGHPGNIGLSSGIGGIAPIDTYRCRPIERAIAYVFERSLGSDRHVCEVTAHEIGHTISLEHEYKCQDPMTYLTGCGEKTFQDSSELCGTYSAVRCACRGGRQNTVEALLDLVGPASTEPPPDLENDLAPPTVELTSPADGETLPENGIIRVVARAFDDLRLARVELIWDFNGQVYGCPSSSELVTCTATGDVYTWSLEVGTGRRTFRVRAVDLTSKESVTPDRSLLLTPDGAPPPPSQPADRVAPVVTLVSPSDGSSAPPSSTVTVVADITDDVGVERVALAWGFNRASYACPTQETYVSCTVEGSRYTWVVRVGVEAPRPFSVRAFDAAGNEGASPERTVRVETVGDLTEPEVSIESPENSAALLANSEILVVATATDDVGVVATELIWDFNGQTYPCPHASTYVDCAVEGDRRTWRVRVGTGDRTFRVRARDASGRETVTADRRISLTGP